MVCATSLLSLALDACLLVHAGSECLNSGFKGQTQGKDWGWLHRDSLRWLECDTGRNQGVYMEGAQAHHRNEVPLLMGA